jgi:hypothetical protein
MSEGDQPEDISIGGEEPETEGTTSSGRLPYDEPVLRPLGALRDLTFKSPEKNPFE